LSPKDIVVHCDDAQHVAFASLGEVGFLTSIITALVTMLVVGFILDARNSKDMKATYEQNKHKFDSYEREALAYQKDRNDLAKEKEKLRKDYEVRLIDLVQQGNDYQTWKHEYLAMKKEKGD
jgi:cell division protein FtsB